MKDQLHDVTAQYPPDHICISNNTNNFLVAILHLDVRLSTA